MCLANVDRKKIEVREEERGRKREMGREQIYLPVLYPRYLAAHTSTNHLTMEMREKHTHTQREREKERGGGGGGGRGGERKKERVRQNNELFRTISQKLRVGLWAYGWSGWQGRPIFPGIGLTVLPLL